MSDAADPRAPITLFTFFLELSRALPVPPDAIHTSYVARDERWEGWAGADLAELLGGVEVDSLPVESVPHTSIVVRHLAEAEPAPVSRVEATFGDWAMKGLIPPASPSRPDGAPAQGEPTIEVRKSVVALTRFVPRAAHPIGSELTVRTLHRILFDGLVHLNALLSPLGFLAGRWDVGPLTLADLPPEVAVRVDNAMPPGGEERATVVFVTEVHDGYPALADEPIADDSFSREAVAFHRGDEGSEEPFLQVFRFIHAAEGERLVGDHTRALVDLNTAVELLIGSVLYYGNDMTGVSEADAKKANDAPLRPKVRKYLAALLQREIDLDDTGNPWGAWFSDGYMLRNRAVHEGELLEYEAVERAFAQASDLVIDMQRSLEAIEPLARLGRAIQLDPRPSSDQASDQSLNIYFPWDEPPGH